MIGFGGMILFMSYLVFRCIQNPSVMVTKNYYEAELKYQDLIDARSNALEYNDSLTMERLPTEVIFYVPYVINKNLSEAHLEVYHKSNDQNDHSITLTKNDQGLYLVTTKDWQAGSYRLKLTLHTPEKNFYKEFPY
jgi:hypothetical protein